MLTLNGMVFCSVLLLANMLQGAKLRGKARTENRGLYIFKLKSFLKFKSPRKFNARIKAVLAKQALNDLGVSV